MDSIPPLLNKKEKKMRVELYDTTLRDGSQKEGISFSVEDKLRIVRELDDFGIPFIACQW